MTPTRKARAGSRVRTTVSRYRDGEFSSRSDSLSTEEPLELRLLAGSSKKTLALTMRTPGHDFELAAGFLYSEGILTHGGDLLRMSYCTEAEQRYNTVNVTLRAHELPDVAGLERHFFTTSACGVCGRASLETLEARGYAALGEGFTVAPELLLSLPEKLRAAQRTFEQTGGLHAAALFTPSGELLALREDVGRHNALDKLVGWALLEGRLPLSEMILVLSGRSSYELMQKALAAGVPVVCALGAPSSLAVSVAQRFGMTLVGFLRADTFNVYAETGRLEQTPYALLTP